MNRCLALILPFAGLFAAGLALSAEPVRAADPAALNSVTDIDGRVINLGLNKSMVIDLPEDIRDVLVSNPTIADAVVRNNRKIYLIGMSVGEANVFLFGAGNRQIAHFELVIGRDTVGLENTLAQVVPGSHIKAQSLGDSLVLSGTATSPEAAATAANIAGKFVGSPEKVINSISISGSDQVNLRVVIAEVEKDTVRKLGIDMAGTVGAVTAASSASNLTTNLAGLSSDSTKLFGIGDTSTSSALNISTNNFTAMINALKTQGVVRTLAEPNVTAISGQPAKVVVGGEIPYTITSNNGNTVNFKEYGVILKFTPVVLTSGRISLNINTEVSDIDTSLSSTTPAIKKRGAETTVEVPSGGAIAIGGLLRDNISKTINGTPGLSDLPILGALFKSEAYQRQQTELVVFVTPYIVQNVAPSAITRPDQNLNFQADAQSYFLNQINRIYRVNGAASGSYQGRYGFSYD
ncbi:type II and III secretion system protein family protein [Pleomorphomonas sp. PLEO]|uniref:type II and III secretion system protein family protein n=1 Tax=Pleomorphomonas sp. PLEO TaxID=3239306 RepID=UPI00351DDF73